ncbi:N-6 DNA methylase [Helicobacter anatolicus]|uniref:N-6 DNA methylase n=1 Tax=Helicobacter anatolicus TaxID=2905874 RepID=UPI001E2DCA5F|nr:N-6 DNA methylase [Helicobacter anatolicus]
MQVDSLKRLIDCFEYLKRYYTDILDVLQAILELILLQKKYKIFYLRDKKEITRESLEYFIKRLGIENSLILQANFKLLKLEKFFNQINLDLYLIEEFFYIITQQKTSNKLYGYSTPLQINHLLSGLLDVQENETIYNPCYGMGSIFFSLVQVQKNIKLYGEELDYRLSSIAFLILKICDINTATLYVNDLLKSPKFIKKDGGRLFDKVLCNPPLYAHVGIEFLKNDQRFTHIGAIAKHYPELAFLIHSLSHLKKRGVFIVRNQVLQKNSLEAKLREKLCSEKMIKAIIELPKNIFPHQNNDFSILVIEPNSKEVLHINAAHQFFYKKEGKYNHLIHLEEILRIFREHKEGRFSKITHLEKKYSGDLRASHFVSKEEKPKKNTLRQLGFVAMRGQRVYGGKNDEEVTFFDVGIADFKSLGFSEKFENLKKKGDKNKIEKYRLHSYDLLLSLRGMVPKVAILGEIREVCVANAGVVVLRHKDVQKNIALYCFLFSLKGEQRLKKIYQESSDGVLNINHLLDLALPKNYEILYYKKMQNILKLSKEMDKIEQEILALKQGI